jgi:hypothetical protein
MADEPRLNSVERFRKQPGRFVLEVHSHCEVPAGCGGVVLRWRNPHAARPVTLCLYTAAQPTCLIDGTAPSSAQVDLVPGPHAVAIVLDQVDLRSGLLLFSATHEPKQEKGSPPSQLSEQPIRILSAGDGTWKFSLADPVDQGWISPTFDDRAWLALISAPVPQLTTKDPGYYQCRRCAALGATCLGIPALPVPKKSSSWLKRLRGRASPPDVPTSGKIWIRKVFEVPVPAFRGQSS